MGEFSIDGFPMLVQMTWVNVFDPPDIGSGCFRGFGRSRASEATTRIPESCLGTWRVDVEWSGLREMIIHDRGIIWKGSYVVAEEVLVEDVTDGGANLRFTVFVPLNPNAWTDGPAPGIHESFDITIQARSWCSGVFKRQGDDERLLTVEGRRLMSDEERKRTMPTLVRTTSKDPDRSCPVCLFGWEEDGVVQVETSCGHSFCFGCVVSVCNMTPPKDNGECPICRKEVSMDSLRRVTRR